MAGEDLAPNYILEIEGHELRSDVTQFVTSVEYESADGIVDIAKVTALNPDFLLSASRVFAPGNEMNVYMGYGPAHVRFIGRVVLMTPRVMFPSDSMPILEVTGYSKDYLMREQRPVPNDAAPQWLAGTKQTKQGPVHTDTSIREVIESKCLPYGFHYDSDTIDDAPMPKGSIIQPAAMSDFELVRGLANITGFLFWVDYDHDKGWTLHFKDPAGDLGVQDSEYTFRYNQGDKTTLMSFEPEMVFADHYTALRVQTVDKRPGPRFGKIMETTLSEELGVKEDPAYTGALEELDEDLGSAETVRIFAGDFSFAMKTNVEFRTKEALEVYAAQWYRRMREQFIVGNGTVMGLESLRARQVHRLEGLGLPYDGRYYFSKVQHIMSKDSGYHCGFFARKVLEVR